jgi:hypothetical protein
MAEHTVGQVEENRAVPCEDDLTPDADQTLGLAGGTAGSNVAGGSGGANPEGGTGAANRAGGTGGANLAGGTGGANPGDGFYAEGAQDHPAHSYKWLYGEACTKGLKGRSKMNKAELEQALKK